MTDPLIYLIVHSDCDGEIAPEQAALLAPRIRELLPSLPPKAANTYWDWPALAAKFADGLAVAASRNESVTFH